MICLSTFNYRSQLISCPTIFTRIFVEIVESNIWVVSLVAQELGLEIRDPSAQILKA